MNCEQFQIELMKDPFCEDRDFIAHRESCARCAQEWEQARAFEEKLRSVMSIQPGRELASHRSATCSGNWWQQVWVKAASVLLLIGATVAGFNLAQHMFAGNDLPQLVVRHIEKEPELLAATEVVDEMRLAEVLSPLAFSLEHSPGSITAAAPCWIRKGRGMHLVIRGDKGPVTVLLMPGEHVAHQQPVKAAPLAGMLVPTAWGSMAVVSHAGDDIEPVVRSLQQNVRWKGMPSKVSF